jgi:hypothetical protein
MISLNPPSTPESTGFACRGILILKQHELHLGYRCHWDRVGASVKDWNPLGDLKKTAPCCNLMQKLGE